MCVFVCVFMCFHTAAQYEKGGSNTSRSVPVKPVRVGYALAKARRVWSSARLVGQHGRHSI
jgi:hypothetical protein